MSSVLRREMKVVAPLASELSGAGQSRAESSRGVLLGFSFLLLMIMMISPPLQVRRQARPSSLSPSSRSYSIASPPPGGTLMQWTSHQAAAKPRIAGLVIQTQLSVKREVVSGSSQGARPMIKVLALGPGTILSRSQEANTPARPPYEALSLNRQKKL
jgi:hypothetical protein